MATYYVATTGSDSNAGTSEGAAFASLGKACATATTSGDIIYVKSGTYTLTSTTNNANGGRFTIPLGVLVEGYQTTPGDLAAMPVISAGSLTSFTMCTMTASFNVRSPRIRNIELDGNSQSTVTGLSISGLYTFGISKVICRNCTTGFSGAQGHTCVIDSAAISCGTGFSNIYQAVGCLARSCTSYGFSGLKNAAFCLASGNGNTGFYANNIIGTSYLNCASHGNTNYGFDISYDIGIMANCLATSNSLHGYSIGAANNAGMPMYNNANWNNTSGAYRYTTSAEYGRIDLTADPYTNAASNDFTLNNNAGGGALLRSAGFPGAMQSGNTGYLDVGAFQVASSASGGGLLLPRPMNGGYSA